MLVGANLGLSGQCEMPGDTWAWPEFEVLLASDGQRPHMLLMSCAVPESPARTIAWPQCHQCEVEKCRLKELFLAKWLCAHIKTGEGQREDDVVLGILCRKTPVEMSHWVQLGDGVQGTWS